MYNRDAVYMLVIYLCGDGDAVCVWWNGDLDKMFVWCFMFYTIWLLLESCQAEQMRKFIDCTETRDSY